MPSTSRNLLRRLGDSNEPSLRRVMVPVPHPGAEPGADEPGLDSRTKALVRLAALVALEAPTPCLCWAVELARGAGVDDGRIVAALLTAAAAESQARLEAGATPIALGLGYSAQTGPVSLNSPAVQPGQPG
ncbi:MAG: carboxymuconolactone decarboxylase family protein [Solirubrobacterales bacterium]|nr:carboxymuconolactone decarboxylase family protein [Solirubrobacterales bacterium]